jgi:hypothetical protein
MDSIVLFCECLISTLLFCESMVVLILRMKDTVQ